MSNSNFKPLFSAWLAFAALALAGNTPSVAQTKPNAVASTQPAAACPASLDFRQPRLQDEAPQHLCQYAGKVILVVNTASYCGFTSQYQGLEALYAKYQARGLVVLGFPSNDFGGQEPDANKKIADFCFNTYGVQFPMLAKTTVIGPQAHPFYQMLAQQTGKRPQWNFHKYLIGRDGKVVASYPSLVSPQDRKLVTQIETLLAQP